MKLTKAQTTNLFAVLSIINYTMPIVDLPPITIELDSNNEANLSVIFTSSVDNLIEELYDNGFNSDYKEPHLVIEF